MINWHLAAAGLGNVDTLSQPPRLKVASIEA